MIQDYYVNPRETWDRKKCEIMSKAAPKNAFGDSPPKGLINDYSSPYNAPGLKHRYNGGCIREGKHYMGELTPLPEIHPDFEIVPLPSWGDRIQLKSSKK